MNQQSSKYYYPITKTSRRSKFATMCKRFVERHGHFPRSFSHKHPDIIELARMAREDRNMRVLLGTSYLPKLED